MPINHQPVGIRVSDSARGTVTITVLALLLVTAPTVSRAVTCEVPSTPFPLVQAAIDDPACDVVAIGAGQFEEHLEITRSVDVVGISSTFSEIVGTISVAGSGVEVHLGGLRITFDHVRAPSDHSLLCSDGATVTTDNVVVVRHTWDAGFIFYDGFESGSTTQWSNQVP